jgi:cell wall-associated NlpC family hydrolase
LTIFSGSYDAFRRSVCSNLFEYCPTPVGVSIGCGLWYLRRDADTVNVPALRCSWLAIAPIVLAALCAGACASTGATPRPFPMPGGAPQASTPAPSMPESPSLSPPGAPASTAAVSGVDGYALAGTALALRGTPYLNGGTDLKGFDCSGFTQYVFAQHGLPLPREVREQFRAGKTVKVEDLAPGDILFFTTTEPGPSHVAIAVGGDQFVHAPSSTGVVRVEHLSSSYWSPRYLGARRITN